MSILFLGWLLWSKGFPQKGSAMEDAHFFALASLLMVLICPVSHSQYFVLALPLIMSILIFSWFKSSRLVSPWLGFLFSFYILANLLPLFPAFENIKRMGVMFVPNFILFAYGTTLIVNIKNNDKSAFEKETPKNYSEA